MALHKKFILQKVSKDRKQRTWDYVLSEKVIGQVSNGPAKALAEQFSASLPSDPNQAVHCAFQKTYVDKEAFCSDCDLCPATCNTADS